MGKMTAGGGLTTSKLALATAQAAEVLSGKTFYAGDKAIKTGSMPNRGGWSATATPVSAVTIPEGYHNGSGTVGCKVWDREKYLYFYSLWQGGYDDRGWLAEHVATLIGVGDGHNPAFFAHEAPMNQGSSNICGAGMVSIPATDHSGVAKLTALATIKNIFTNTIYNAGAVISLPNGTSACFCFA